MLDREFLTKYGSKVGATSFSPPHNTEPDGLAPEAMRAISTAEEMISSALDGHKHNALVKASHLLGGYVGGNHLPYEVAFEALKTAIEAKPNVGDMRSAIRTIKDGLTEGMKKPLDVGNQQGHSGAGRHASMLQADFVRLFTSLRITTNSPIEPPPPVVKIGEAVISTEGNITTISGASKSGKSALCGVILAGAIREPKTYINGFDGLEVILNTERKAVIHIDTEQAKHHQYRNLKSTLKRIGKESEPANYYSFNIRELDLQSKRFFTSMLFKHTTKNHGGIHLAVIDGIADYITSPNDEEASNTIVDYFEKLAVDYCCPILLIVHENPNTNKQRGHLGSQLQRKSESVISVRKDGEFSFIEPQFLRNAGNEDVPQIKFKYNKEAGFHTFAGIAEPGQASAGIGIRDLELWAKEIFETGQPLARKHIIEKLEGITGKSNSQCGNYFDKMKENEIIEKDGDGHRAKYKYVSDCAIE